MITDVDADPDWYFTRPLGLFDTLESRDLRRVVCEYC